MSVVGAAPRAAPAGRRTFVVTGDCTACGACLLTCPERALRVVRGRPPLVVLAERCTACAACAEVCPADACWEVGW